MRTSGFAYESSEVAARPDSTPGPRRHHNTDGRGGIRRRRSMVAFTRYQVPSSRGHAHDHPRALRSFTPATYAGQPDHPPPITRRCGMSTSTFAPVPRPGPPTPKRPHRQSTLPARDLGARAAGPTTPSRYGKLPRSKPAAPIKIVGRRPMTSPSSPPTSAPAGRPPTATAMPNNFSRSVAMVVIVVYLVRQAEIAPADVALDLPPETRALSRGP